MSGRLRIKIIAAAGWNDPLISPLNSVRFYERVDGGR
jgi:hypothetical protein